MSNDCQDLGDCASARLERIYEYLDGALTRAELSEVHRHLQTCPECSEQHDLECIVRSVVRRSCHETAPADLKTRIILRIDEVRTSTTHSSGGVVQHVSYDSLSVSGEAVADS